MDRNIWSVWTISSQLIFILFILFCQDQGDTMNPVLEYNQTRDYTITEDIVGPTIDLTKRGSYDAGASASFTYNDTNSIFVSYASGNDSTGDGSYAAPLKTIDVAVSAAVGSGLEFVVLQDDDAAYLGPVKHRATPSSNFKIVAAEGEAPIWRYTTPTEQSWVSAGAGKNLIDMVYLDNHKNLLALLTTGLLYSADGGLTWAAKSAPATDVTLTYGFETTATGRILSVGSGGGNYHINSLDTITGAWTARLTTANPINKIIAKPSGTIIAYAGNIYISNNDGTNWSLQAKPSNINTPWIAGYLSTGRLIIADGFGGTAGFGYSDDDFITFVKTKETGGYYSHRCQILSDDTIIIEHSTGAANKMYRSTTQGQSYEELSIPVSSASNTLIYQLSKPKNSDRLYLIKSPSTSGTLTNCELWYSDDKGDSWTLLSSSLTIENHLSLYTGLLNNVFHPMIHNDIIYFSTQKLVLSNIVCTSMNPTVSGIEFDGNSRLALSGINGGCLRAPLVQYSCFHGYNIAGISQVTNVQASNCIFYGSKYGIIDCE